jgi:hypothetical protein
VTYKITVTYAAGHEQEHPGLSAAQAENGIGAFARDIVYLEGEGVRSVTLEVEVPSEGCVPTEGEETKVTTAYLVDSGQAAKARSALDELGIGYTENPWQPGIRQFVVDASDPAKLKRVFA